MHQLEQVEDKMVELLEGLEEDEFDFEEEVAIYQWRYPSHPNYQFQLAIGKLDEDEVRELGSPAKELH